MLKVDGTQSIRQHILWAQNMCTVCLGGMNITNVPNKVVLIWQMCEGEALTAFNAGLVASNNASWALLRQVTVNREPA
jgi:hypothetical protein